MSLEDNWLKKAFLIGVTTIFLLSACKSFSEPETLAVSENVVVSEEVSENRLPEIEEPETPHIFLNMENATCDLSRIISVENRPIDIRYEEVLQKISTYEPGSYIDLTDYALTFAEEADIIHLSEGQDVKYHFVIPIGEKNIDNEEAEICVSEIPLKEMEGFEIEDLFLMMPNLTWIEMCNCGYSNEEMAALSDAHEDIRIIWEVHLEHWTFRTDILAFTSDKTCADDFYMQNEDAAYLKYCKDLLALDLGHNYVNDFSFLENLTNLRVLIVVDNVLYKRADESLHHIESYNLEPLNNLTEMRYLEIFSNAVTDISFLNNMPKLMDVNISYNPIYDASPLYNHPKLKRLWLEHTNIPASQVSALRAAYPNTIIVSEGEGSIDQGWRANEDYYAMRRMFHNNAAEDIFMED